MSKDLREGLKERIRGYLRRISDIPFAGPERRWIHQLPDTDEELLDAVEAIIRSSDELNRVLENCPSNIFVVDEAGEVLRINRAFETMTGIDRETFLGRNAADLEAEGLVRPSVCLLALKEGRTVSVLQEIGITPGIAVTGVPILGEDGGLFRVVSNAVLWDDVSRLGRYIQGGQGQEGAAVDIVAESGAMKGILHLADTVKNTESSILITGETGVGKGVLARYLHETGNRCGKRFVHINCGAIPETLMESELFGYEHGAFTGADKKGKPGLIELADGGTLFLDEISELPLPMQVKLLHFLQSRHLTRVGGTREVKVDVRVIAASNKDLLEQVRQKLFRQDLYYRLNVIPIRIPPLRERREDIGPMAEAFLDHFTKKYKKRMQISRDFLEQLALLPWLGNVRELENYVERVVVTNNQLDLLSENPGNCGETDLGAGEALKSAVRDTERDLIVEAYETYGSSYKVAKALGISQSTAYRKIKKYVESR